MVVISKDDVTQLVREPSPAARALIASKISENFCRHHLTARENQIAVDIFRLLLNDTARSVRRAIADNLKGSADAPHDIIMQLSNDHHEVAAPVLEFSEVLTEEDLLELLDLTKEVRKLIFIAKRRNLSGKVSNKLIGLNNAKVTRTLVGNQQAEIFEEDIAQVLRDLKGDKPLLEALVCRGSLSVAMAESLYNEVSERMKKKLVKSALLTWNVAEGAADTAHDAAILRFLSVRMDETEMEYVADRMHKNKRLNYSLVLRALCTGTLPFFEVAMARMANLTVDRTRTLLREPGDMAFDALYRSSGMPEGYLQAVKALYQLAHKQRLEDSQTLSSDFQRRMVEEIYKAGYHESIENMGYFLSIMRPSYHAATH